jgi:endonuclease III
MAMAKVTPSEKASHAVDWAKAVKPLIARYKGQKHPLDYHNHYQLVVMVLLSAQDSDKHINAVAPAFFEAFPNMEALSQATLEAVQAQIKGVRKFRDKAAWLLDIAQEVKQDKKIPMNLAGLTKLKGLGRKSANVILREAGKKAEGVIVDLHVVRVAPRLGIASGSDPKKIETQIMEAIPQKDWGEAGMAFSFLGREICRPKPKCPECPMRKVCAYAISVGIQ